MGESKVHLVVPSFVNGCDVLGGFFDDGNQNETNEATLVSMVILGGGGVHLRVLDVVFVDDVFDLVNEEDGHECDHSNSEGNGNNAFRCRELGFVGISVLISIFLLIGLQNFSV